jgi:hypothetical protein
MKTKVSSMDKVAAKIHEDTELCATAFLGYAKADLFEIAPVWRTWNPRPLVPVQVNRLEDSMLRMGLQRYVPSHRIPLAVDKDWIEVDKLTKITGTGADDLPLLVFRPNGTRTGIPAPGGQHREGALKKVREKWVKILDRYKKDLAQLEKEEEVEEDEINHLRARIAEKEEEIDGMGMWGFVLYDLGERLWTY